MPFEESEKTSRSLKIKQNESNFLLIWQAWLYSKEHSYLDESSLNKPSDKVKPSPIKPNGDYGDKLFLTPIIEREKSGESIWKELARVSNLTDVLSYSGFFTVSQEHNSNLFFWFFPAAYDAETAPIILWLNGGPGTSSMFGLFVENGPLMINDKGFLDYRSHPWTMTHSIIYIDSPVGTGFSFTEDEEGYARTQEEVANDLYQALMQFFRVFPEYAINDFYIAGESYAGKYVPSIAHKIHRENLRKSSRQTKFNLKGIMIGSGYSDPINQNEYGDYLYNLGLIDKNQRSIFHSEEDRIKKLIRAKKWREATDAVQNLILGYPDRPSYFHNITDFQFYMNVLTTSTPDGYKGYTNYLSEESVRRAIHVGDQPFLRGSTTVLTYMIEDICKSVKPDVEKLLNEDYKVLIYAPQLDIIVPHTGVDKFVQNLKWEGSDDYDRAVRGTWKVHDEIAGYAKTARNLVHVVIRNAGHISSYDQPQWTLDMVNRFTRGLSFY
ncbi:Venom serine carboxypeptidase [Orchesella cincta]|uniref:Carboxypeptidase n=1 Tax=Orchesella cincta TaxID=48709 RepID=A0A1D2NAV4_ORCCI|nr:Venom serine carboxypeptidase [Orchesella cincta]